LFQRTLSPIATASPRSKSNGSRPAEKRVCALTLLGVLLCACTPNSQWEDTTGQGRTDEQRKADYSACYEKAGFKPDGTHPPLNEGFSAITKCMSEHGWRVVAEPIKKWEDTTGQGRTDEQWKVDDGACREKAGVMPGTNVPLNEGFPAFTKCMSERGWRVDELITDIKLTAGAREGEGHRSTA
jgi:hypothetical protein